MGTGANVGSFGAGFAKSLTGVLLADRDRKQKEETKRKDQAFQLKLGLLPQAIENMEDPNDLQELLGGMFPDHFGEPGKPIKSKGGAPTPMDQVGNILRHFKPHLGGNRNGTVIESGFPGGDVTMQNGMPSGAGEQMSDGSPAPTAPAAADAAKQVERKSFFGIPLMSAEQKATKAAKAKVGATGASLEAMEQLAQRIFAGGGAKSIEEARVLVGIPHEKPIELNANAKLIDPHSYATLATGNTTGADGSYNVQRFTGVLEGEPRSKARPFVFDPRTKQTFEQDGTGGWKPVTKSVLQIPDAPQTSIIVTPDWQGVGDRNTRVARPFVDEQGNPILPRPTAAAQDKDAARDIAVNSVGAIKSLGDGLITKIGPAQRADAAKRGVAAVLGNDPNYRAYTDARLSLAGNLAILTQGSRPSDADIKSIWLPMVPDVFADTRESAAVKWRLIQISAGLDAAGIEAAAAAFQAGAPGAAKPAGTAGGVTPKASSPAAAGTTNAGAAATRLKARQLLLSKGKAADEAAINVFLSKPQNVEALQSWQPGQ